MDLLFRHALRRHLFSQLLFHAHRGHDGIDNLVGIAQRVRALQLLDHGIDLAHDLFVTELFAFWSLNGDGGARRAHGIGFITEALHHLFLSDGGIHVRHGKGWARGLGKSAREATEAHEDYEPER